MYYVEGLFGFFLVPESDDLPDDVSNESYDDKDDKEPEKKLIYYRDVWKRSCPFACYIAALHIVDNKERVASYSYYCPFQIVSFVLLLLLMLS